MRCFILCVLHLCVETGPCGSPVITTLLHKVDLLTKLTFLLWLNLDQLRSNASFWPYSVSSSALFCIKPFPKHSKKASVSLRFSFMKVEAQSKGKPNYKENFWVSCFSDGLHSFFFFPEFIWSLREWKKPMNESERSVFSSSVVSL